MATSVLLAAILLCGALFVLCLGNRLVKPTLFFAAFVVAGTITLVTMAAVVPLDDSQACMATGLVPIGVGLLAGCMALCMLRLGLMLLGGGAGSGVGYALYVAFLYQYPIQDVGSTTLMFILCVGLGGLIGMAVLLRCQKAVLIVASSALGATVATAASALLLAHVDTRFLGSLRLNMEVEGQVYVWPQVVGLVLFFLLGVFVQCRHQRHKDKRMVHQNDALTVSMLRP